MANNYDLNSRLGGNKTENSDNTPDKKPIDELHELVNSANEEQPAAVETADNKAKDSEDSLDRKLSKTEMAALIAQNLSAEDESEKDDFTFIKTNDIKKASAPKQPRESEKKSVKAAKTVIEQKQTGRTEKAPAAKIERERVKETKDSRDIKDNKAAKPHKEKSSAGHIVGMIFGMLGGFALIAAVAFYVGGLVVTNGKFLPNTTINGIDVSLMTAEQAAAVVYTEEVPEQITLLKQDGTNVKVSLAAIDYKLDSQEKIQALLDKKDTALWFMSLFGHAIYKADEPEAEFDEEKLKAELQKIDWGDAEPVDAYITQTEDGFAIVPDEPGDKLDMDKLTAFVEDSLQDGFVDIDIVESGSYIQADVTSEDLEDRLEQMNSVVATEITIDFDFTQEVLSGKDFAKWVTFAEDGSYTVDREKVMGYVEQLASKYDTYNTERKFHATLQGDITVPASNDAKYGWWIYKDETCDLLVKLIEEGKSTTIDPVYYYTTNADGSKGYIFTGREEARTAEDDIGDTYVEIDLTAQTLWHYVDGEMVYTCGIVSGQLNPEERMTLPGVYKVWYKARNYTMNGENSTESWTSTCAYWTRVAIVGIGLHDSQWRGNNVGGEIYKYNGSHGCINMTLAGAKYIYENVDYSTPVVMYY